MTTQSKLRNLLKLPVTPLLSSFCSQDYSLDKSNYPCLTGSVSTKAIDNTGFAASCQSCNVIIRRCNFSRVGCCTPSQNAREHPGQSCAAFNCCDLRGRVRRTEAPHSQRNSISFSSLKSIVVTCFGVINLLVSFWVWLRRSPATGVEDRALCSPAAFLSESCAIAPSFPSHSGCSL